MSVFLLFLLAIIPLIGNYFIGSGYKLKFTDFFIGGSVFTIIPILVEILPEVSYYRKR